MAAHGKAALVTGAGQRLGRAIAAALSRDGFAVAVHYNASRAPAEALVEEIEAAGGRAAAVQRDLSDITTAGGLIEDAAAAIGPLTLLVNSASFYEADSLMTLTPESWRRLTDVNVAAPLMLMQAFARRFDRRAAGGAPGAIINLLDGQLAAPSPRYFSYFCAKAALASATKMAALELAPHIRVNAVAPGLALPSGGQTQAEYEARQALTPLGVGLGAGDIVDAALYLAAAAHVTGQTIVVDSGQQLMGFGNAQVIPEA